MRGLILLGALVGCTGTAAPDPNQPIVIRGDGVQQSDDGHGKAEHAHGDKHAHGHHPPDGATTDHRFEDPEKWSKVFDDPERDAWQKPAELVKAAGITDGMVVADIGAGTGYLGAHLATAVGPKGRVILADVEPTLVEHMNLRFADQPQVKGRLIPMDKPGLDTDEVDAVIFLDVVHHISGRVAWFEQLKDAVKPGGRVIIVDFKPGDIPVGPPPEHRLAAEQIEKELGEAGWKLVDSPEVLEYQFVQIYEEK